MGMRNMQQSLLLLGKNCQAAQAVSCLTSRGPGRDSASPRDSHTGAWVPQWFTWKFGERDRSVNLVTLRTQEQETSEIKN